MRSYILITGKKCYTDSLTNQDAKNVQFISEKSKIYFLFVKTKRQFSKLNRILKIEISVCNITDADQLYDILLRKLNSKLYLFV